MSVHTIITLLILFTLAGCASSDSTPKSYYYTLVTMSEQQTAVVEKPDKLKQIKVRQVVLPDYLNQPNLILKISDHQIKIANYHFWAEDLRKTIQQVLINELNAKNVNNSFTEECKKCEELIIIIENFYPTQSGEVVLAGSFYRTTNYTHRKFMLTKQLEQGGYDEAVSAMRSLLSELADQL